MKNASLLALVTLGLSSLGCAADVGHYDLDNPPAYDDEVAFEQDDVELGESTSALTLSWTKVSGCATDVGVAGDGTAWITGCTYSGSGFGIYKWNGSGWQAQSGRAENIAVTPSGTVWVTNGLDEIYKRRSDGSWERKPGRAEDLDADDFWAWAVSPDGVYVLFDAWGYKDWQLVTTPVFYDSFGAKFPLRNRRVAIGQTIGTNRHVYLAGQRDGVVHIYRYSVMTNRDVGPWEHVVSLRVGDADILSDFSVDRTSNALWLTMGSKVRIYQNGAWSEAGVEARTLSAASGVRAWAIKQGGSIYRTP